VSLRITALDGDVLALHPPELMHGLPERELLACGWRGCRGRGSSGEYPDAPDVPRWLRGGHERRPEKPEGTGGKEPDSTEPHGGVPQHTRGLTVGEQRCAPRVAPGHASAALWAIGMTPPPTPPRAGSCHVWFVRNDADSSET
jgi:hypothetical protein